ncbi:hypothetical protein [Peribacillus tepidiphilus]|uniref:hypothetical protein n=1 Tax=Peribacillus tepidiphilus TaxID=2652445 RepID=UPI0035B56D1D
MSLDMLIAGLKTDGPAIKATNRGSGIIIPITVKILPVPPYISPPYVHNYKTQYEQTRTYEVYLNDNKVPMDF